MNRNPFNTYKNQNISQAFMDFFKRKSVLSRLIFINLTIFVFTSFVGILFWFFNEKNPLKWWFSVPADWQVLLYRKPWTIITYMFTHYDFIHFLFNMLWLYFFGNLFVRFINFRKLSNVYLLGGIVGAVLFMVSYSFFPVFENVLSEAEMVGASASVTAVIFAVSFFVPNYEIALFFIGKIKLKHIALIIFVLDILALGSRNTGGHIAHIGGALLGLVYGIGLRTEGSSSWSSQPHKRSSKKNKTPGQTDYEYNKMKKEKQDRINEILDKISKSGYDSLTSDEKEILFKSGN